MLRGKEDTLHHVITVHNVLKQIFDNTNNPKKTQSTPGATGNAPEKPKAETETYYQCLCCNTAPSKRVEFSNINELRAHLAVNHFKSFLTHDLQEEMKSFPVCPWQNCKFFCQKLSDVEEHFHLIHKEGKFNVNDLWKCNICYLGPFDSDNDLVHHLGWNHGEKIEKWAEKLNLKKTLLPQTRKLDEPFQDQKSGVSKKEKAIKAAIGYHSPA